MQVLSPDRPTPACGSTDRALPAQMEMVREAHHLVGEFKEHKKHALLNLLSDSVAGTTFFVTLAAARDARAALFSTLDRIWSGLSDTAKAFIIIASARAAPARMQAGTPAAGHAAFRAVHLTQLGSPSPSTAPSCAGCPRAPGDDSPPDLTGGSCTRVS